MARAKRKVNYAALEEKYGATLGGPGGIRTSRQQHGAPRQLEGRYLGLVRQKVARERGPQAAIEPMQAGLRK